MRGSWAVDLSSLSVAKPGEFRIPGVSLTSRLTVKMRDSALTSYLWWKLEEGRVGRGYLAGYSDRKVSACNVGDLGLIPGSGRSLGEGNGNPPQYSCLENSMDRRTWWARVHGIAKSWTLLSNFHFTSQMH